MNPKDNDQLSFDIQRYCDVEELYLSAIQDSVVDTTIFAANQAFPREAALDASPWYSGKAQTLYELATDSVFLEYTPLPEPEITPKMAVQKPDINEIFKPEIKVYPNPAKGMLFVEYNFESVSQEGADLLLTELGYNKANTCKNGNIVVYSKTGKKAIDMEVSNKLGIKTIDISKLVPASYIIEITDCYGFTNSVKIVKQ
jgi:hypothetical protein